MRVLSLWNKLPSRSVRNLSNMTIRAAQKTPVNFLKGWPSPQLLIPLELETCASHVLQNTSRIVEVLEYGNDEGFLPLRKAVADWLTRFYAPKDPIPHLRLCISGGASQNLACVLQTYTDPVYTRNIWMVAPTYYLACNIFADSGFDGKLRGVPEDEEGINLKFLRHSLEQSEKRATEEGNTSPKIKQPRPYRKIYKHIIYAVPTFANPSGCIMTLDRRQELVKLAREFDALIVTDDVYDMLQWPASPAASTRIMDKAILPRIVDIDRYLDGGPKDEFGNAMSNGSFSKLVSPGCRTGWAEGTEKFAYGLSQTGSSRSGGAPSQLVAAFMEDMIVTNTLEQHIYHKLQSDYGRRYRRLTAAIQTHLLPLGVEMPQADKSVAGGYFVWLTLPKPLQAKAIWKRALSEENVTIIAGERFKVEGDEDSPEMKFDRDFRLSFAWENEDLLEDGVARLGAVIERELAAVK